MLAFVRAGDVGCILLQGKKARVSHLFLFSDTLLLTAPYDPNAKPRVEQRLVEPLNRQGAVRDCCHRRVPVTCPTRLSVDVSTYDEEGFTGLLLKEPSG